MVFCMWLVIVPKSAGKGIGRSKEGRGRERAWVWASRVEGWRGKADLRAQPKGRNCSQCIDSSGKLGQT